MDIKIVGKTKALCKAEIKFATAFFANYIMGESLAKVLDIEIHLKDQGENTDGHAYPLEDERYPRYFHIGINPKMSKRRMLHCIAHEMVHVKQYARGELSDQFVTAKWKGETFKITRSTEDYLNWPWEIEAYGRDRSLYMFYKVMLRTEKVKFKNGKLYIGGNLMRFKKLDKPAE